MFKNQISSSKIVFALILGAVFLPCSTLAQTALASISGSVQDPSGLGIPAAKIEVQQVDTHWTRSTQADSSGVYFITGLPIGRYRVTVTHAGFRAAEPVPIELLVGQERTLSFKLAVTGRMEQIGVTSSVSEIDQTSAVVQGRMDQAQIKGLPLNGRNWANLLPLIPVATDAGTSDQRTVRFAGHGRDDNNISLDGVDATGISNQPQKTEYG
jgi:hypothetical protein